MVLEWLEYQLSDESKTMVIGWMPVAFEAVLHTAFGLRLAGRPLTKHLITTAYIVRIYQPWRFKNEQNVGFQINEQPHQSVECSLHSRVFCRASLGA
jgi:hypothetical protein